MPHDEWQKTAGGVMAEIIDLQKHKPHMSGEAICHDCRHEWIAVSPLGTFWLECPECRSNRGRYRYPSDHERDRFQCDCGNMYFSVRTDSVFCPVCAAIHPR